MDLFEINNEIDNEINKNIVNNENNENNDNNDKKSKFVQVYSIKLKFFN